MNERWLSPTQLEEMFGIKKKTQDVWRHKKKLPYSKLGGFVYYDIEKIHILLEQHSIEITI
ncbi:MAG: helix-turn-helix domain-containing protein [Sulfuricurvum sp.]|nr:helix-turn-helix domain-containing protein [Sulfuricurvum sp.]MDP3587950.1 helix-turn-helix domain-containing protein [Sulfuricurvum sp.]